MNEHLQSNGSPDLAAFPSAAAQDGLPVAATRGGRHPRLGGYRRFGRIALRVSLIGFSLVAVAVGTLLFMLFQGPVSNANLHDQIERQLSEALGVGHQAKIGETRFQIGKSGFLSIDADDVKILKDEVVNLGVAKSVSLQVDALALLKGEIKTKTIRLNDASVALFAPSSQVSSGSTSVVAQAPTGHKKSWPWMGHIDIAAQLSVLRERVERIQSLIDTAGVDSIELVNTRLIGFEALGLRSGTGRLTQLRVERNREFQEGLSLSGALATEHGTWSFKASWEPASDGSHTLIASLSGLTVQDLMSSSNDRETGGVKIASPVSMVLTMPFDANDKPRQATAVVSLGKGAFELNANHKTVLTGAQLNLRVFPSTNQIDLEQSPIRFGANKARLLGGIRFPRSALEAGQDPRSIFEVLANDIVAHSMPAAGDATSGSFRLTGELHPAEQKVVLSSIRLDTPSGALTGSGWINEKQDDVEWQTDLAISQMSVADFKQFWPLLLAPGTRNWAQDAIKGGTIKGASVSARMSAQRLRDGADFDASTMSVQVPLTGVELKTTGKLPPIQNASGTLRHIGMETEVDLKSGTISLGKDGVMKVSDGKLSLASYRAKSVPGRLDMRLVGKAPAAIALGSREPLSFSKALELSPGDISGGVDARVGLDFALADQGRVVPNDWEARIKLAKVSAKKPVQGRRISNATVTVNAKPGQASVEGSADIDGVPAKLALVERFGRGAANAKRKITMTLDDAARKKMGLDTGAIIKGPVRATITAGTKSGELVEVDLRNARLSFPWIGWSKGKGIPATASFSLDRNAKLTRVRNLKLRGKGFRADGAVTLDQAGPLKLQFSKVQLNKTDDFDVTVERVAKGYSVAVNARGYDGRALIRAMLNNDRAAAGGKTTVRVNAKVRRLLGFGGQSLNGVTLDLVQSGPTVTRAWVRAVAQGGAPLVFTFQPATGGMRARMETSNAGALLQFLDIYQKMRAGSLSADLLRDGSGVFRGPVRARNFLLLNEPRLAKLLRPPSDVNALRGDRDEIARQLRKVRTDRVRVDDLRAIIAKGPGSLSLQRARLTGGDASAAFKGRVYDQRNRIDIRGTYLPGRGLNRLVSKIPILGLAFGKGKVNGLLGVTFRLKGQYGNPELQVNPLSIIAPGVFREIFKF